MVRGRGLIGILYSDTGFLWEKLQEFLDLMGFVEELSLCTFQGRSPIEIATYVWKKLDRITAKMA